MKTKKEEGFKKLSDLKCGKCGSKNLRIFYPWEFRHTELDNAKDVEKLIKNDERYLVCLECGYSKWIRMHGTLKEAKKEYKKNRKKDGENGRKKKRNPLDSRLRHECFKRDGYKCLECGATNKEKTLHADHIVPVSQGGTDELENLQTLCDNCNLAKYNKCWVGGNK